MKFLTLSGSLLYVHTLAHTFTPEPIKVSEDFGNEIESDSIRAQKLLQGCLSIFDNSECIQRSGYFVDVNTSLIVLVERINYKILALEARTQSHSKEKACFLMAMQTIL